MLLCGFRVYCFRGRVEADVLVDSTMGKVLEKVGGVVHNRGLVEKGRGMREERRGEGTGTGGMVAN